MMFHDRVNVTFWWFLEALKKDYSFTVTTLYNHPSPYSLQTVTIVPEVVLGVHVLEVQVGIFAPQDNLVPQDHLVQLVLLGLVLGRQVQEQLLHVPVEQTIQVGAQIERQESQIILFPGSAKVRNVFAANKRNKKKSAYVVFWDSRLRSELTPAL